MKPGPSWIDANLFLPGASRTVLVLTESSVGKGCYRERLGRWETSLQDIVTHWMEVPDADRR